MNPVGYFSLLGGLVLLTVLAVRLGKRVRAGALELNSGLGIRTTATLSSRSAWERGHAAAEPYLRGTAIVGGVALATAVVIGIGFTVTGEQRYADFLTVPSMGFLLQAIVYTVAVVRANRAAKISQ